MDQKKYEVDVSSCLNLYINIIKKLGSQDILDIKKLYPEISLYDLFNTIALINEAYKEEGKTDFIIFSQKNTDNSNQVEFLSNNCYISINKNETLATIRINADSTLEEIEKEIHRTGIIHGIMPEILEYIITNKIQDPYVFAKGDFPVPVKEATYTFNFETTRPFPVNLQQGTKGVYLDTTITNRTILGKTIAKIKKAEKGILGKTITGLTIPTKIQPIKTLVLGANVFRNGLDIMPTINGLIDYSSEVVEVIPTLILKEPVINQTIDFDGTIIIENIVQNSTIKATHDITIYGTSNSAVLEAEGYIYLLTGFVGNTSKATAKKGIFCGYAHNSKLTTIEGDINIGYESLHAKITSGKSIYIEKKASGGKLSAKENIVMDSSGSERIKTKTELTIHYNLDQKYISMAELFKQMQSTERKYQVATKELSRFEISSDKPRNLLIKDSAFQQLTSIVFELQEQLKEQLQLLTKNSNSDEQTPEPQKIGLIVIKDKAWNGTSININDETLLIDKNANQGSTFRIGNYGIIRERYEKEAII